MRGNPGQFHLVIDHAGRALGRLLRARGRDLAPVAARAITQLVASALQCVQGQGLLHADIKPAHILIEELALGSLVAKLGDFGHVMEAGLGY